MLAGLTSLLVFVGIEWVGVTRRLVITTVEVIQGAVTTFACLLLGLLRVHTPTTSEPLRNEPLFTLCPFEGPRPGHHILGHHGL